MPLFTATITITHVIEAEDIIQAKRDTDKWRDKLTRELELASSEAICSTFDVERTY